MANFKVALEDQVQAILFDYVGKDGVYSNATNYVVTWDKKIPDFDAQADVPIVVVIARQTNQKPRPSGEMGTSRELWDWQVDVYYLDVDTQDFTTGYSRQADITERMRAAVENETRLRGLSVPVNPTSPTGAVNEYVYNNDWTNISWDHSGQEGDYYAFVSEMHLLVNTARN